MADSKPMVVLRNVSRVYGQGPGRVVALSDVSISVAQGEFVAIVGKSGSGKSTLLNIIGGLDRPSGGEVWVDGQEISAAPRDALAQLRRSRLGFVFQDYNLLPSLTLAENVGLPLELGDVPREQVRAEVAASLARVGLQSLGARRPDAVSGGQRQRAAIARALVGERNLVLADEPTGALDAATGTEVIGELRAVVERGATVIVATHDRETMSAADRVIDLVDGVVVPYRGVPR